MAETCPRRGFRDVKLRRSGAVVTGGESAVKGATMLRCSGSHTLPGTKVTGNVSGVVLKSLCPRSQNSEWEVYYVIWSSNSGRVGPTFVQIRSYYVLQWEAIQDRLTNISAN